MNWLIQIKLAAILCLAICVGCDRHHTSKHDNQQDPNQPMQSPGEVGKQPVAQKKGDPSQQPPIDGPIPRGIVAKPIAPTDEVCVALGHATLSDGLATQVADLKRGPGSLRSFHASFNIEDSDGPTRNVNCYSDLKP